LEEQYTIAVYGIGTEVSNLDAQRGLQLEQELNKRARLLTATRQYADELVTLAQTAQPGSKGANQLAQAVESLADQFERTLPIPYVGIAKEILDIIENIRARQSLADAIESADPAVQELAKLLAQEMRPMKDLVRQSQILVRTRAKKNYAVLIDEYRSAVNTRAELSDHLKDLQPRLGDPNAIDDKLEERLLRIQRRLSITDNWLNAIQSRDEWMQYQNEVDTINSRYTALVQIMSEIEAALEIWAVTHRHLSDSVRTESQPDVQLLVNHAMTLNRLIKEVKQQ